MNSTFSPGFREGGTLTYLNGYLYLYGGLGEEIRKDIDKFNLSQFATTFQKQKITLFFFSLKKATKEWEKPHLNKEEVYPFTGMFGHTAIPYNESSILIYGGQS